MSCIEPKVQKQCGFTLKEIFNSSTTVFKGDLVSKVEKNLCKT